MWDVETRPIKAQTREWLLERARGVSGPYGYIGLPAGEAIFEKALMNVNPPKAMYLYEKDPKVFAEMSRATGSLCSGFSLLADVDSPKEQSRVLNSFLGGRSPNYLAWFDYCGCITERRLQFLNRFFRKMSHGSLLAVTFRAGRECCATQDLIASYEPFPVGQATGHETPSHLINRVNAAFRAIVSGVDGWKVEVLPYKETRVPMFLIALKKSDRKEIFIDKYLR